MSFAFYLVFHTSELPTDPQYIHGKMGGKTHRYGFCVCFFFYFIIIFFYILANVEYGAQSHVILNI